MATDWKEEIPPGEAEEFERYARMLGEMQEDLSGGRLRALHAKQHAGLVASFEVLPDLPEELRQGLFAAPGVYDAYVRFSNGANRVQPDSLPDIRGVAVKVLGVDGPKIIPGLEDARTQDFLFIQAPVSPFVDVREFVTFMRAAAGSRALLLPRLCFSIGPFATAALVGRLLRRLATSKKSFAAQRFFTAAAIQWGPHAAKLDLRVADGGAGKTGENAAHGRSGLADDLASRVRSHALTYDLGVQLWVDASRTPIEDASVEWSEDVAPFRKVARLTVLQQDPSSERGKRLAAYVERLSFDPWHARREHKPLGAVMRARNAAYRVSGMQRGALDEHKVELLG